ncbi:MAG: hypothetical protein OXS28_08665, partial [Gammaproteobacteria bacterium]|nr:hypothetical protein [Gammaproteobacteria bacterium]
FANGAVSAAFFSLVSSAAQRAVKRTVVTAGAGAEGVSPQRKALQKKLDALVKGGTLSSERSFENPDAAAREVLGITAPLSKKYGLEVGGNIIPDANGGYSYTLPIIGGPGSVALDPSYIAYHTHSAGGFRFSNQFSNYFGNVVTSDMAWIASSGKSLYLGVQIDQTVRIGVCRPGICYDVGRYGTDPGRILQ